MWVSLAIQAATAITKKYQERAKQPAANETLANNILDTIKAELNTVKNDIFHKLNDIQKEELQGLLKGLLDNLELYQIGMPNEEDWLKRLIEDANFLEERMYIAYSRYILSTDYYNSRDFFAMYAPIVTTYIYLLNEDKIDFNTDNSASIVNTINSQVLPGANDFLALLTEYITSKYSAIKETYHKEPPPDQKMSFITLSYDVLDSEGGFIEVNIMEFVKNKQKYRLQIATQRQNRIDAEIQKLKDQIELENYIAEITKLPDEIMLKIAAAEVV